MEFDNKMAAMGYPVSHSSITLAPFDVVSDFLRGMRGAMLDMYRCPDKLIAVQEKIRPMLLESAITLAQMGNNNRVFIPLHRGADGFMSLEQFENFYWPGLKALMMGLIDAGLTPCPFFEGHYDQRLEYLKELPAGKVVGMFDRTDLFRAKEIIGDTMCILGGMPLSLLQTGTPEQVREHTKKVIDEVGKNGGFIMGSNTILDEAKPELVKAWVEATMEYGQYG
jgi:uroporphyrinogen-III decarboxylase